MYSYGFQGQERDDEVKGSGNSYDFKYRMHDPRLGRFFAIDPLSKKYPELTPYQFAANQVIHGKELEGLENEYYYPPSPAAAELNYLQQAHQPIKQVVDKTKEKTKQTIEAGKEVAKRMIVNAYKAIYSGDQITAPNLIEHYAYGYGKDYELSLLEMKEVLPTHDMKNNPIVWDDAEWKEETFMLDNGSKHMEKTSKVYAMKGGTLGNFSITISGEFDEQHGFVGELTFMDIYDFDASDHRPALAEAQVTIARNTLPGKPFKVSGVLNVKIDPQSPYELKVYDKDWNYITTIKTADKPAGASEGAALEEPGTDTKTEEGGY